MHSRFETAVCILFTIVPASLSALLFIAPHKVHMENIDMVLSYFLLLCLGRVHTWPACVSLLRFLIIANVLL